MQRGHLGNGKPEAGEAVKGGGTLPAGRSTPGDGITQRDEKEDRERKSVCPVVMVMRVVQH